MAGPDRPLLQLRGWSLDRHTPLGPVPVLSNIDLDVGQGRWLAILGANGSGKSSLLKFLAGDESPLQASRSIMFQDPDEQIIAASVQAELKLGLTRKQPEELLQKFGLADQAELDPRLLSAGQKQRLVLATALGSRPEVLFCDEPTALQDDRQASWVLAEMNTWRREEGRTLISATSDPREVDLADDLLVLEKGKVLVCGSREKLRHHPAVVDLLGPEPGPGATARPEPLNKGSRPEEPLLEVREVGFQFVGGRSPGVSFALSAGTRLGVWGPNGCGKSSLLAACVGARKPDFGQIVLQGRALYRKKGPDLDHGLALLAPQFPEYLFTRSSVEDELKVDPFLAGFSTPDFLLKMGLDPDLAGRNPHSLSSGQKRRLALGLVLHSGRQVLLLDEPTAALDRRGRSLVVEKLHQIPRETALVVASHDLQFLEEIGCQNLEMGSSPD